MSCTAKRSEPNGLETRHAERSDVRPCSFLEDELVNQARMVDD